MIFAKYFESSASCNGGIPLLCKHLINDLAAEYPDCIEKGMDLSLAFDVIHQEKREKFIFLWIYKRRIMPALREKSSDIQRRFDRMV
ncbi:hypothetical protein IMSAGC007_04054 [Lachnospiraceae bacterium]|nr:hypothetical protein IMSAGC007_04054 [Lachnospiraceae bacterium]